MRVFAIAAAAILLFTVSTIQAGKSDDAMLDMDEKEFEEFFNLDPVVDPEEFEKRQGALKSNEDLIKQVNQEYAEGKKTWYDSVNKFSNLPEDEFVSRMTGLVIPEDRRDSQESKRYFNGFRRNRQAVPDQYSAVEEGHVSPVKSQGQCGSCVAFASMSSVETCFKKITGVFGDYSEQQMVDCGYGASNGAWACDGAYPHAYIKWAGDGLVKFSSEQDYPYAGANPSLICPDNITVLDQGAQISGSYYTYGGDEELMKKMVYTHGAVLAGVWVNRDLQNYRSGVFSGCPDGQTRINHAISVVGYGTENGVDYWLIKNSWGTWWGDNGYFKLQRGVQMCGIGPAIAAVECEKSNDSIDEETTTSAPTTPKETTTSEPETTVDPSCVDDMKDCPAFAEFWCWDRFIKRKCKYSCGQCKGQSPAPSALSFDKYSDCEMLVDYCHLKFVGKRCKKTCSNPAR